MLAQWLDIKLYMPGSYFDNEYIVVLTAEEDVKVALYTEEEFLDPITQKIIKITHWVAIQKTSGVKL